MTEEICNLEEEYRKDIIKEENKLFENIQSPEGLPRMNQLSEMCKILDGDFHSSYSYKSNPAHVLSLGIYKRLGETNLLLQEMKISIKEFIEISKQNIPSNDKAKF